MLAPPPHDVGDLGLAAGGVARVEPELGPDDDLVVRQVGVPVGKVEAIRRDLHDAGAGTAEIGDPDLPQRGRDVGAVPAGVHAHAPADRARNADRPFEPAEAGTRRAARQHRKADGGAGAHDAPVDGEGLEVGPENDRETGEPGIGDEEIGSLADNEHVDRRRLDRSADALEVLGTLRLEEHLGRSANAVRRVRP